MVHEALAGPGTRGARPGPHGKRAARRAKGLEGALVDRDQHTISALDEADSRQVRMWVAGPAALLIAKIHKIAERVDAHDRVGDKDALDLLRLLRAVDTGVLADRFRSLLADDLSRSVTGQLDAVERLVRQDDVMAPVLPPPPYLQRLVAFMPAGSRQTPATFSRPNFGVSTSYQALPNCTSRGPRRPPPCKRAHTSKQPALLTARRSSAHFAEASPPRQPGRAAVVSPWSSGPPVGVAGTETGTGSVPRYQRDGVGEDVPTVATIEPRTANTASIVTGAIPSTPSTPVS